jgi:AraC-like DNA-binding protein
MPGPPFPIEPGRAEMPDTAFLFEPPRHKNIPYCDMTIPKSLFTCRIPASPLAEFVDMFWFYRCDASVRVRERVLPAGTMELVVDLRDDARGPLVYGTHSEPYVADAADDALSVGVHFKPGGASPLLDLPAGELHNTHVSLDTLWGSRADALREQLLEARGPTAIFRVLEQALLARSVRRSARHPAVAFALREFRGGPHAPTVGDVTDRIGLSPRTFIRVFTEEVGLTPKLFCRVRRFQEVLRQVRRGQRVEWADVALDCGYCDQAHLIHDFRVFSGLTPTAFLQVWGEHLEYGARWTR